MPYHNRARENWFIVAQLLSIFPITLAAVFHQKSCFNVSCFLYLSNCYAKNEEKQTQIPMAGCCNSLQFFI